MTTIFIFYLLPTVMILYDMNITLEKRNEKQEKKFNNKVYESFELIDTLHE